VGTRDGSIEDGLAMTRSDCAGLVAMAVETTGEVESIAGFG
jgi:hypothetical protein